MFIFGVKDCQLGKHSHVSSLKTEAGLKQSHQLFKVSTILVEGDQLLQLISMNNNVQSTHLCQSELLIFNTSETNLLPGSGAVGLPGSINSSLILLQMNQGDGQLGVVADVVVQKLGSFIHATVETSVSNLANIRMVGT